MNRKIIMIGPVYPYKGGISHYTGLMYRELVKRNDVEMLSYKMQYPKFLFHKEQRDYSNDSFKTDAAKYMLHTANPFNIIRTAPETGYGVDSVVASILCTVLFSAGTFYGQTESCVCMS